MRFAVSESKALGLALSIGLTVLALPLLASSQCIEITPETWDYGDVEIGASSVQVFNLHSCATSGVTIYYIGIDSDDTGAFAVTSEHDVPFPIPGGETEEVEVTFAPPGLGAHEAFLWVVHDAPGSETFVNLYGTGVQQAPVDEKSWALIKALYR